MFAFKDHRGIVFSRMILCMHDLITQSARQAPGVYDAWMRAIAVRTALAMR